MVSVELSGRAANDDSGRFIRSAGLSCLSRSSNLTNETARRNQMNQIPATRREMVSSAFIFSESSQMRRSQRGCQTGESSDTRVEDMIGDVSRGETRAAGHGGSSTETVAILSRKDSRPLFPRHRLSVQPCGLLAVNHHGRPLPNDQSSRLTKTMLTKTLPGSNLSRRFSSSAIRR
jgi:hypothetical protein